MEQLIQSKLLTCRYWALGPQCPNIDERGVDTCGFAHWDTGTLASTAAQRGTCSWWLRSNCRYGQNCFYEHRHTGVRGLNQETLLLTGVNLEIADAAANSGFNTFDHEALMSLIWAVRRVMFRNSGPTAGRPQPPPKPQHPVYPDRYRPSGIGDNTHRKRRLPPTSSPPPFHAIQPLGSAKARKRARYKANRRNAEIKNDNEAKGGGDNARGLVVDKAALDRVLGSARVTKNKSTNIRSNAHIRQNGNSQNNPINLLSDSEGEDKESATANTSAKRRKATTSAFLTIGRHGVDDPSVINRNNNSNNSRNIIVPIQSSSLLRDTGAHEAPVSRTVQIVTVLNSVKEKMKVTQKSMIDCQLAMKTLFNNHSGKLGEDGVFAIMNDLSKQIYRAHDGARDAAGEIVRSVEWLENDEVKIENNSRD